MDHITRECADSDVDYRECGESDDRHVIRHPIRQCAALPSVRSIWRTGRCRRHVFKHLIAHTGALWCPRTSCGQSGHADVRVVPSCVSSTLSSFPGKRHATDDEEQVRSLEPESASHFQIRAGTATCVSENPGSYRQLCFEGQKGSHPMRASTRSQRSQPFR